MQPCSSVVRDVWNMALFMVLRFSTKNMRVCNTPERPLWIGDALTASTKIIRKVDAQTVYVGAASIRESPDQSRHLFLKMKIVKFKRL